MGAADGGGRVAGDGDVVVVDDDVEDVVDVGDICVGEGNRRRRRQREVLRRLSGRHRLLREIDGLIMGKKRKDC